MCAAFLLVDLQTYFVEVSTRKNRFKRQTYCTSSFVVLLPRMFGVLQTGIWVEVESSKPDEGQGILLMQGFLLFQTFYSDLHMELHNGLISIISYTNISQCVEIISSILSKSNGYQLSLILIYQFVSQSIRLRR